MPPEENNPKEEKMKTKQWSKKEIRRTRTNETDAQGYKIYKMIEKEIIYKITSEKTYKNGIIKYYLTETTKSNNQKLNLGYKTLEQLQRYK